MHLVGNRLPPFAFWFFHLSQSSLLAVGVAWSPDASSALAWSTLYVLLLIESFFILSWVEAGIEFVIAAFLLSWALLGHTGVGVGPFTVLLGVLLATCAVTGWLVRAMAQAESDALTGVLNRRGLQRRILEALRTAPEGTPVVVALIDLDHFKTVNDTLGHAAGDDLLRQVAGAALQTLPGAVDFARWGGDEFALLSRGRDPREVADLVDALREALPAGAGMSVGIAGAVRGGDLDALLAAADDALYAVKRSGRGTTAVHGAEPPVPAERRRPV